MRQWFGDRPWHQLVPLPGLVLQALVLLGSRRVWTDVIPMTSRSGVTSHVIAARMYLLAMALSAAAYWASYSLADAGFVGGRGMRPPTEAEVGCVVGLLRVGAAITLYAFAAQLVWRYVLAS